MELTHSRIMRQPLVAAGMISLTVVAVGALLLFRLSADTLPSSSLALALGGILGGTVVLAYVFPIYIRHNTKICLTSIPLFLLAAVLPPALTGCCAFLAVLGAERFVQKRRGTAVSDILTNASRWALLTVGASAVAHLTVAAPAAIAPIIPAFAAALVLWLGDLVTLPVVLIPVSGERPARIMASTIREGGLAEATQYIIGVIGLTLAHQQLWALTLVVVPAGLVYLAFRKELDPDTFQLLESMADSVDLRDGYTLGHSQRVAALVEGMMNELDMHGQEARQIIAAARVHNIGKAAVPDHLLIKSEALTPEEQLVMEAVPEHTVALLQAYPDLSRALEMVRHHLERWDGSGYPDKLAGPDIPFGARIIGVADAYDAMTSDRPHRRALTPDQAARILRDGRGRQWDPAIVDAFLRSINADLTPLMEPAPAPVAAVPVNAQRAVS